MLKGVYCSVIDAFKSKQKYFKRVTHNAVCDVSTFYLKEK